MCRECFLIQSDPLPPRSLSLHLHGDVVYVHAARSSVAMPAYVCVYEGGGGNGKLNQRISRIYRRAIPGYCKCTVSVTSCRIFLGNPGWLPPRYFSLSLRRTPRRPLREKKLSPGYYRSFDLVSRLPRNSPAICYRSLSRSTLNGRTRELSRSL